MLNKNTIKDRLLFRQKVISCSKEDLIRVAEKYLINKKPKRCVIAGEIFADQIQSLGLKIKNI
jgi:Zn-dependent M16 (insulinase) family peptidase